MTTAVTSTTQTQPVVQSAPVNQESTQAKPKPAAQAQDTVQISSAAQAALQEATETAAQTAKEARSGDRQAQKLLAKEAAAAKAAKR